MSRRIVFLTTSSLGKHLHLLQFSVIPGEPLDRSVGRLER